MRQNPGNAGRRPHQDEVTVRLPPGALPAAEDPPPDGVTVLVPGAVLAPAPTPQVVGAGEAPVFVDDSGGRKRLLRLAGVLIALLSIGFIAIVGVALAVPNVATSVGLGNVVPFIVPGAAALPPQLAPLGPRVQVTEPKPKPRPVIVAAPTTKPKPVAVDPTTTPAPVTATSVTAPTATAPAITAPATTQAPATQAPATTVAQVPGGGQNPVQGGQVPVGANPPAADANAAGNTVVVPADQTGQS
jgi:hypothetical protein